MRLTKEQEKTLEVLEKYGFLIKFKDRELYHGRASSPEEIDNWKVDPTFESISDRNIIYRANRAKVISTSSENIAKKYADYRVKAAKNLSPETYRIMSVDPEALLVNGNFKIENLDKEQRKEFVFAIKETLELSNAKTNVTKFTPVSYRDRYEAHEILECIESFCKRKDSSKSSYEVYISDNEIKDISKKSRFYGGDFQDLCKAHNARAMFLSNPYLVIKNYVDNNNIFNLGDETVTCNNIYVAAWLAKNHIVGVTQIINSDEVKDSFPSTQLFYLAKINTEKEIGKRFMYLQSLYNPIAKLTENLCGDQDTLDVLEKADSQQTLAYFAEKYDIDKNLKLNTGSFEGFNLGEHTETVLRVFDENFSDEVPSQLLPFIRTALISHDIGKGFAVQNEDKENQKKYNKEYAEQMYNDIGIPKNIQNVLQFVIGDSQTLTHNYYIEKDKNAKGLLHIFAKKNLEENFEGTEVTDDLVNGLVRVCEIVQTCDGGAYTTRAVTRGNNDDLAKDTKDTYYYNAVMDYTRNFEESENLTGDGLTQLRPPEGEGSLVE